MLVEFLAIAATVIGLCWAWPQVVRILHSGETAGVSGLSWTLSLCSAIAWVGIGIVDHITATIIFNVLAGFGSLAVLGALAVHKELDVAKSTLYVALTIAASSVASVVFGSVGISTLGLVFGWTMLLPQVWKVLRVPATGISAAAWWLSLSSSVCWGLYGILDSKPVLVVSSSVLIVCAAAILWHSRNQVADGVTSDQEDPLKLQPMVRGVRARVGE